MMVHTHAHTRAHTHAHTHIRTHHVCVCQYSSIKLTWRRLQRQGKHQDAVAIFQKATELDPSDYEVCCQGVAAVLLVCCPSESPRFVTRIGRRKTPWRLPCNSIHIVYWNSCALTQLNSCVLFLFSGAKRPGHYSFARPRTAGGGGGQGVLCCISDGGGCHQRGGGGQRGRRGGWVPRAWAGKCGGVAGLRRRGGGRRRRRGLERRNAGTPRAPTRHASRRDGCGSRGGGDVRRWWWERGRRGGE